MNVDSRRISGLSPLVLFFAGVVSLSRVAVADTGTDGIATALRADDLAVVQAGEQIYRRQCAACHGQELEGEPNWRVRDENGLLPAPPHDASGHTWHHADDLLFEITKYGPAVVIDDPDYRTRMPAYASVLDDDEIIAVLSYIKHSWPDKEREWQAQVNGSAETGFKPVGKGSGLLEKLFKQR